MQLLSGFPRADGRFVFEFDSEDAAHNYFNCCPKEPLKVLDNWKCRIAVARIKGQKDLEIPYETVQWFATAQPVKPIIKLFFANTDLTPTLLDAARGQLEQGSRFGIVRISDGQQVIMSSGMQGVLLAGVDIAETTGENWKRHQFWNPADLSEFNRDWRRQLDIEGERQIEYRYRIRKPGTNDPYRRYTSTFRLLQGEDRQEYHLGVFVGRD